VGNRFELKDLVVSYGSGREALTAVDRVNLEVPEGQTLGLVGESGCGKSTLARALVGLVPIASGQILLDGVDCSSMQSRNSAHYRRRVQMVFQDPYSSLNPRMTVGRAIGEAITLRGITARAERRRLAIQTLEMVGLGETALSRYPHQFSGGQRQRVAIARALAVGPEILITDEITSALDVSVQATILNLLKKLQKEMSCSVLFISHDLSVVRYMSHEVGVMYLGQIVERAAAVDLFEHPRHPYTLALMESIPRLGQPHRHAPLIGELPDPRNPPSGCRFHSRCPIGPLRFPERTICSDRDPQSLQSVDAQRACCHFAGTIQHPTDFPLAANASQRS
jgi:peptide/nickel transport system ATP-binding protein